MARPAQVGCDDLGRDGTPFESCPGFYRRSGLYWPCAEGWTIRGRSAYMLAREASAGLDHTWPATVLDDLPGPLADGVMLYRHERARVQEHRDKAPTKPATPGMERF